MEAGVVCYETEDGLDEIKVDRNDYESGLNEALKLMRKGDRAKLILPNHLAHGLVGDLDKIPPLSILLLDVSLEDIMYTSK
jgi:FKBP-type peptidyl-prolyl cis-trans isomerase